MIKSARHDFIEPGDRPSLAGTVLPGMNNSFIGKTPDQTRDANLKVLDDTFRFIDKT